MDALFEAVVKDTAVNVGVQISVRQVKLILIIYFI